VRTLNRRGLDYLNAGAYADALATFRRLVVVQPGALARYHLAVAAFALGRVDEATRRLRQTLDRQSHLPSLEFLATIAPFDAALDHRAVLACRQALYHALRRRHGAALRLPIRARGAVLKVGYVSSFFHRENWMKAVWGLLDHHDRRRVDVHLFSDAPRSAIAHLDGRQSRRYHFHDISRLDNRRAARLIARQRLDLLVDLNGFSKRGRLPLYVLKPAPIQVAWFNVMGTTGMPTFDAVLGDAWVVRNDEAQWYAERVVALPMSNQTFGVTYPVPDVQPPPCIQNGFVTFGCLSPLYKLNEDTLDGWATILRRSATSRLLLADDALANPGNRAHLLRRFRARGVTRERLTLLGGAPHREFLRHYDAIDIALDPFVYGGGTSTIEAIWQGVPVLTCGGDRWTARQAVSILRHAGLDRFVEADRAAYIDAAVAWGSSADTPARLRRLRRSLRSRVARSPVCDGARFARCMEDAYRRLQQATRGATPAPARVSRTGARGPIRHLL
jgi:protein O-GlcNAc transferase